MHGTCTSQKYMQSVRATKKTDVYSFGVFVLEVVSGKRPTDVSFIDKGVNIAGWLQKINSGIWLIHIVDTESLDAVATQCVSSNPEERPTMQTISEETKRVMFIVSVLEVVSGKRPTDNIAGWRRKINNGIWLIHIVDTESLDALLSVATQCVSSNPEERPTMQTIVQIIDTIVSPCPAIHDS
ncbi:hypothetical protein H5410_039702 [Solanum commersonii]|uniref:Protein kinase domain-containing protein n=1 Tax=Solanum commersonii TaxID=4109 RepID=A0A9J5XPA9_SOLCO|nr:hypothetical protein H5410_039702 [Solanum commersonii]